MPFIPLPDGTQLPAESVDFEVIEEPEIEVQTEEGVTIKCRCVVTGITRVDGEDNPNGPEPLYSVNVQTHPRVLNIPESLISTDDNSQDRGVQ